MKSFADRVRFITTVDAGLASLIAEGRVGQAFTEDGPLGMVSSAGICVGMNLSDSPMGKQIPALEKFFDARANPKNAAGQAKIPLSLVPLILQAETSLAFLEGKLKYGEVNWRETPVFASVYLDAGMRHWQAYSEGEDRDPISRVHHLGNASACAGIILDAANYGTLIDDRKMSNGNVLNFMDALKQTVQHLKTLHADMNPKHYKITDVNSPIAKGMSAGRSQALCDSKATA